MQHYRGSVGIENDLFKWGEGVITFKPIGYRLYVNETFHFRLNERLTAVNDDGAIMIYDTTTVSWNWQWIYCPNTKEWFGQNLEVYFPPGTPLWARFASWAILTVAWIIRNLFAKPKQEEKKS